MSAQEPVARGSLGETPFAHLAIYLYRRTAVGTLVVDMPRGDRASVRFKEGRATGVKLSFYAQDLLDALLPLCGLIEGEYSFFETDLLGDDEEALTGVVDPYALLVASLGEHARDDMVEAVLQRYAGNKLRLQPGRDLDRLGLKAGDKPLIELVRAAPATPEELVAESPLQKQRTRRLVYALIVSHMLSPHEERNTEIYKSQVDARSVRPGFSAVNEVASMPGPRAWQLLASLRPAAPNSSRPAVSIPPQAAAPRPISSMRPTTPTVAPTSPTARTLNGSLRAPPPPAPEPLIDERTARLRKAEQLLQRSRHDEALEIIDDMIGKEGDKADLLALKGHTLVEKHRNEPTGLPRAVVDTLKKALELDADQVRALYARGLVYQLAGEPKKAYAAFRRVLQIDPKHLDAQRAVRLAKIRDTM